MLSFINLSVQDRRKTVVENMQAVFHEGFVYGLYAPDAALLKPLLECISGRRSHYKGDLVCNDGQLPGQVGYIDCQSVATARERTPVGEFPAVMAEAGPVAAVRTAYNSCSTAQHPHLMAGFSKKIVVLHDLRSPAQGHPPGALLDFLEGHTPAPGKIVVISSHDYAALKNTCDFIYLFDKKRFPIVVEKPDFTMFDYYFENVFRK